MKLALLKDIQTGLSLFQSVLEQRIMSLLFNQVFKITLDWELTFRKKILLFLKQKVHLIHRMLLHGTPADTKGNRHG